MRSLSGLFFLVISLLSAQVETDTAIRGLVTDSTGAAVPAAAVVIRNVDTGEQRSTMTDASGSYSFPSLVPGKYSISATHAGFKKEEVTNRVAQVAQTAQVDFILQVGEVSEKVTVSAAGAELLSTSNAEIAATINSRLTEELPLQGRNFFDAAVNLPHVSLQDNGPQISFAGSSQNQVLGSNTANPFFRSSGIFAAGNRDSATNVSMDGVNVQSSVYRQTTPQQPPSAIQEVKVHVSGMPAEFGNGAAAVSVITKSGSNELHGQLYEYLRNNRTDASNYFNNLNNTAKNPIHTNQFGAAAGGPIIKNKLFIFGAYEGLRFRQSVFTSITRPPQSIENGDFSNYRPSATAAIPVIYDPYNYNPANGLRVPFPNNIIPTNRIDPVAAKFDQLFLPASTSTLDGVQQFTGNNKQILNSDQGVMRVDYALSERDRIYGRYGRVQSPTFNHTLESLAGILQNASDQNAGIHWTRVLSARSVNDFMIGYARPNWAYGKDIAVPDAAAAIGLVNASLLGGGPGFTGTGFSMNSSVSSFLNGTDNIYQLGDDITLVHGRHNFKFGAQFSERRFYYPTQANDKGSFGFSPVYTAACPDGNTNCANARSAAGLAAGGNAFASYLIGAPVSILFQLNNGAYRGLQLYSGAYAQDSWRVSSRLTVNYGIRYEHWPPWHVPRHTVDTFNEATGQIQYVLQNPLDYLDPSKNFGASAPTNPNVPPDAYRTSKLNFAPRFGLAYSLGRNTVLRTGYGIYYDGNSNTNQLSQISEGAGPFNLRYQPQASTNEQVPSLHLNGNFPFPSPTAIPAPNSTPLSTFRFVPTYDPPSTVQEWSASLQQRVGSDSGAEISYQGTHAVHLPQFVDTNSPALPQGALASLSIDARRKFPWYGILGSWKPIGYSRYNGVAASMRNTGWHGLMLISSFTFAKNIASSVLGLSDQGNQDANYPYLWRGSARLTPRLRFVNSFSYDLPFGSKSWVGGRNRYVSAVIGGWRLSGVQDFTTGSWDYITTNDVSGTGYGTSPNRLCDPRNVPGGRGRLQWFNTSCFANPTFGTFGNSPYGVFEDPPIDNLNTALLRVIKIPIRKDRSADLRFRADFFNVLNHTQFAPPNTATTQSGSTTFGRITSARPARSMQFSTSIFF